MASIEREEGGRRRAGILSRARELARSGRYSDYRAIGWELGREGYAEARDVLGSRDVRAELDRLCECSGKDR
jgi:hypothetical protein